MLKTSQKLFSVMAAGTAFAALGQTSDTRYFDVHGAVVQVTPGSKTIVIHNDTIPGYMAAMTMPFDAKDPAELRGLAPGDTVAFRLVVTPNEAWIDHVAKLSAAPAAKPTAESATPVTVIPAEPELDVGDPLPSCRLTNEFGAAVDPAQCHGEVVALTFFFTSCPFPNFCPRLESHFAEAAQKLSRDPAAPAAWHLFSITFDPATDTPARLEAYGRALNYDPRQWSFLTGDPKAINRFADRFDEQFWRDGKTISHNFRTVVVDPAGRIRKIFEGSSWTVDDLAAAIIDAGKTRK